MLAAFLRASQTSLAVLDYFHDAKSIRNACVFLGTAPPCGGRVWVDISQVEQVVPVRAVRPTESDLYSDSLAASLVDVPTFSSQG